MIDRAALLAAIAALVPLTAGAEPSVHLGRLEVVAAPGASLHEGPVELTVDLNPVASAKADRIRAWFPRASVRADRFTVVIDGYPAPREEPAQGTRNPSFLIDFDEPPVAALRPLVEERHGRRPTVEALAGYVAGLVEENVMRGFDPASVVATRREGDCTEHAVLLAALARMFGHASRVVNGVALWERDGTLFAAGHAWTEIHDGKVWRLADATLGTTGRVLYLPLGVLEDEGPGYLVGMLASLSPLDVKRIEVAAARPPG